MICGVESVITICGLLDTASQPRRFDIQHSFDVLSARHKLVMPENRVAELVDEKQTNPHGHNSNLNERAANKKNRSAKRIRVESTIVRNYHSIFANRKTNTNLLVCAGASGETLDSMHSYQESVNFLVLVFTLTAFKLF